MDPYLKWGTRIVFGVTLLVISVSMSGVRLPSQATKADGATSMKSHPTAVEDSQKQKEPAQASDASQQSSRGNNSPNIKGNNNTITINSTPPPRSITQEQAAKITRDLESKWLAAHPDAPDIVKKGQLWTMAELKWINQQLQEQKQPFRITTKSPPPSHLTLFKADQDSVIDMQGGNITVNGPMPQIAEATRNSRINIGKDATITQNGGDSATFVTPPPR